MNVQYIADGYNNQGQRVILWRTGNYQYQLETAGNNVNFEAEYYEALDRFNSKTRTNTRLLEGAQ